jgi:hypothetical protein
MTTQPLKSADFHPLAQADHALAFTPARLAVLVPYAFVLWAFAWSLIHFRGPRGAFEGGWGIATYLGTIPITMVINWLHLKLARLPKQEIVNAVAITLTIATSLDGTFFWFFPDVYGSDPALLRHGAAFIIWAGAVAFWLAFITRLSATRAASAIGGGS